MKLFKICCLWVVCSILGCEALFGVEVTPNIAEAATIINACSRLVSVSQQITNAVNNLGEPAFVTSLFQSGATSLPSSVQQTYSSIALIARDLQTVTNANSGDLNTIFSSLSTNINTFTDTSIETRFSKWLTLVSSLDFSIIQLTLTDLVSFIDGILKPALLKLSSTRISQATFYSSVPKQDVNSIAQKLNALAQFHETVVLPYVTRVVSAFRLSSDKLTQFISTSDQAFQSIEGTLSSSYMRFIELNRMFRSAANEMLPTIQSCVDQFTKRIDEFHDLYIGGSAADYAKASSEMYNTYLQTITNQMTVIGNRLERARNSMSDNPLKSVGSALLVGLGAMNAGVLFTLQQSSNSTKVTCIEQAMNKFTSDFGNLLRNTFTECFTGHEYDLSAPTNAIITVVRDIQSDMAQYVNQLTSVISGLSNSSPASARMQADMFLTAYFSQRLTIMDTILQQLVNMATELGVDYDLLIGKSRYCLQTSVVVAERMAGSFSQSVFLCL